MTTITLRTTKGSELTFDEADDNFRAILDLNRITIDQVSAGGTADELTADYTRAVVLANGVMVKLKIAQTNTSASPTLNVNSTGAKIISGLDGSPLGAGALVAGSVLLFSYDSGTDTWIAMTGGDALTFGGQVPDFYLNYDNFNAGGPIDASFLPAATTTDAGIVRLATSNEAAAGTVTNAAITPSTLAAGVDAIGGINETVLFSNAGGVSTGNVTLSEDQTTFDALGFLLSGEGNPLGLDTRIVTREMINQTATLASNQFGFAVARGSTSNSAIGFTLASTSINITFSDAGGRLHGVIGINY